MQWEVGGGGVGKGSSHTVQDSNHTVATSLNPPHQHPPLHPPIPLPPPPLRPPAPPASSPTCSPAFVPPHGSKIASIRVATAATSVAVVKVMGVVA